MSRAVYIRCLDCHDSKSEGINHGEDDLRAMWRVRKEVAVVRNSGAFEVEARSPGYSRGDWWAFIAAHGDCKVELVDEYGATASIDEVTRCAKSVITVSHDGSWRMQSDDWAKLQAALIEMQHAILRYTPKYSMARGADRKVTTS